jgi:uncharacterized membrane protein
MEFFKDLHSTLLFIQHSISFCGILIIFVGVVIALSQYFYNLASNQLIQNNYINAIRLRLGRVLTLGLEFIVAADLIGTTTTPDYYALGILAIIVIIRTVLSYTLNKEIESLAKEQ